MQNRNEIKGIYETENDSMYSYVIVLYKHEPSEMGGSYEALYISKKGELVRGDVLTELVGETETSRGKYEFINLGKQIFKEGI